MDAALIGFADALRRHGMRVSTAELVDAATCASLGGMLATRDRLEAVLRACLVTRQHDQEIFDAVFALYFGLNRVESPAEAAGVAIGGVEGGEGGSGAGGELDDLALADTLEGATPAQDDSPGEADLQEYFDPEAMQAGTSLDRDADMANLASMSEEMAFSPSEDGSGASGMKVQLDVSRSRGTESPGSLSPATGQAIDVQLSDEDEERLLTWLGGTGGSAPSDELDDLDDAVIQGLLDRLPAHLAEHLRRLASIRRTTAATGHLQPVVLDSVSQAERDQLEESLKRIARGLEGGLSQRKAPHPRGRVDPIKTARRSMRYDGIPFAPIRVRQVRERPRVLVLADVSLSVRATARFTLHVVHGLQSTLGQVRSFAFVDELVELTSLFENHPLEHALGLAFGGELLDPDGTSDYGTVFAQLLERHPNAIDQRTSVLVLGDGRGNGKDPGLDAFAEITRRARTTIWLCSEPAYSWSLGACAMPEYSEMCDQVEVVRDLHALEKTSHTLAELV